jgi:hypothetical protein
VETQCSEGSLITVKVLAVFILRLIDLYSSVKYVYLMKKWVDTEQSSSLHFVEENSAQI